jgi:predicted RNA binding protein YcfA (HicA-like mRNA interferase family)
MKVRDVLRMLEEDGWGFHSQRGSHRQYVHPRKVGRVTVPGKTGDDITGDLLSSIFRQAQIDKRKK